MRPTEVEAIIAPLAGRFGGHFRIGPAIKHPVVGGHDLLHDVERIRGGLQMFLQGHKGSPLSSRKADGVATRHIQQVTGRT